MRRVQIHALLAFVLLFTQQVGIAHLASHAAQRITDPVQQDKTHPSETLCEKCTLYASLGTSPPATPFAIECSPALSVSIAAISYSCESRTVTSYQSRAPPVLF